MARKLILLALAGTLGLAVTGVASAHWFNVIRGTRGDDTIAGTTQRDFVLAFAGNDQVSSGDGRDIVYAGKGNDSVDGGAQFDRLFGGPGDDSLSAGDDGALIWGGEGNDTLNAGNSGRNRLHGAATTCCTRSQPTARWTRSTAGPATVTSPGSAPARRTRP